MIYTCPIIEFALRSYLKWEAELTSGTGVLNNTYTAKCNHTRKRAAPSPPPRNEPGRDIDDDFALWNLDREAKLCLIADMQRASGQLTDKEREVVYYLLMHKYTYSEVMKICGIADKRSINRMKNKGLQRMCRILNGGNVFHEKE